MAVRVGWAAMRWSGHWSNAAGHGAGVFAKADAIDLPDHLVPGREPA